MVSRRRSGVAAGGASVGEPVSARTTRTIPGDNVLLQLFRTLQPIRELMATTVAGTGLTSDEFAVLGAIGVLGPTSPSDVASALGVPRTSMSRYVGSFLDRGLVARAPNPEDGRSYLLEVTPRAKELQGVIAPRIRAVVGALGRASSVPLDELNAALVELETAARVVAESSTDR